MRKIKYWFCNSMLQEIFANLSTVGLFQHIEREFFNVLNIEGIHIK